MELSISTQVLDAGKELAQLALTSDVNTGNALNSILNRFLASPFRASAGFATDSDGQRTENFASLIYTASDSSPARELVNVPADTLACAIEVSESMDLDQFRAAYRKIAQSKTLKKTPLPQTKDVPVSNITLGIIFARRATLPVEQLAEELDCLNRQTPNPQWPDMVVVLSAGVINYAVQFPGGRLSADFLPPGEGALTSYTPPMYIVVVMRPTGAYTFNKMLAFMLAHLAFFSPGVKLPNWSEVTQGIPKEAIVLRGYQYNLSGQLLPVPREFYNDRYIAPPPFRIEDKRGNLLSTLQFLPWQDGGVILLKGKLPLVGLLVFLGKKALERGGVIRPPNTPDTEISYVIPITQTDFAEMLRRLQRQSNMVVRRDPTKFVVQKFADEGSSSPFMARLFMGTLRLREAILPDQGQREAFDKAYEFVLMTLLNTRASSQEIIRMLTEHERKVSQGDLGRTTGQTIYIDETINNALSKEVCSFLDGAVRALKDGMQKVTQALQHDIGFLFKKEKLFAKGLAELNKTNPLLAAYLQETRNWSGRLIECRNSMHGGWMLPPVRYSEAPGRIIVEEPQILGQPVSVFVKFMTDRVICFVEEVAAHCLQARMPQGISIMEIPLSERPAETPERFRLTLASGGTPVWNIAYHQSPFEET